MVADGVRRGKKVPGKGKRVECVADSVWSHVQEKVHLEVGSEGARELAEAVLGIGGQLELFLVGLLRK